MEAYLRKNRLGKWLDGVGLRLMMYLLAILWFMHLWGIGAPALLAGLALGTLGQMLLASVRQRRLLKRETSLRIRLGGEMYLEEMLLSSAEQAHRMAAELLAQRYPLTLQQVTEDGALCRLITSRGEETVLVMCLRQTSQSDMSPGDAASCLRAVRKTGAQRGVVCPLGKIPGKTATYTEKAAIPLRLIPRQQLEQLAGRAHPATDEQLVALGQRKHQILHGIPLKNGLMKQEKAPRYMGYGTALMLFYLVSGSGWSLLMGAVCLLLGVGSLLTPAGDEEL